LRIFGDHQPRADERPAITDARLMNRHLGNIDFVADKNFLLHRTGFDQSCRAERFSAPNELGNHFVALGPKRRGGDGDIARRLTQAPPARIPGKVFKQQRAVPRLPQERAHLRAWIDGFGDPGEKAGFLQLIDPCAHIQRHKPSSDNFG
jgi:hypothetical protein